MVRSSAAATQRSASSKERLYGSGVMPCYRRRGDEAMSREFMARDICAARLLIIFMSRLAGAAREYPRGASVSCSAAEKGFFDYESRAMPPFMRTQCRLTICFR